MSSKNRGKFSCHRNSWGKLARIKLVDIMFRFINFSTYLVFSFAGLISYPLTTCSESVKRFSCCGRTGTCSDALGKKFMVKCGPELSL